MAPKLHARIGILLLLVTLGVVVEMSKGGESVLALTGGIVPGLRGARFKSVSQTSINSSGEIAFHADLTGEAGAQGIFVISGGRITPVVLFGEGVPDMPGRTFGSLGDPSINQSGDILFSAVTLGGSTRLDGLFIKSGTAIRRVVDTETHAPGTVGQKFLVFREPHMNDSNDVAFQADLDSVGPIPDGIFVISGGVLTPVVLGGQNVANTGQTFSAINPWLSLNNAGDVVFASANSRPNGIFRFSGGMISIVALAGQSIPNSKVVLDTMYQPWMNDSGDIVFVNGSIVGQYLPNAVVRSHNGQLEKIAATGDAVPGYTNKTFQSEFVSPRINNKGSVVFTSWLQRSPVIGAIVELDGTTLGIVANEGQVVDGIGVMDFIGAPSIDPQGSIRTFVANMDNGVIDGIFSVTFEPFKLYFPQMADGEGWKTKVMLANRATVAATGTISFYGDDGQPLSLSVSGQIQNQISFTIPPLGATNFQTDGSGSLKHGWALVQTDQSLAGIAIYSSFNSSGTFLDEVGVPASLNLPAVSLFAETGPSTFTGIALANPNSVASDVSITLRDANDVQIAATTISLPPNGHLAKYLQQLFSTDIPSVFEGKLEVSPTLPLAGIGLRQRESVFTSMPVIP
ncbi:MAG TPA: choice-of-anchor tandem repeat NxxGxxAF-containing protein [Acidobacteriota bacterium]|nr:choice-of-anchor tandem repeat NxxGxxAF-containing protein [Acidobacteriota bacterium]